MESLCVLVMHPDMPHLQEELDKRFTVFRYYDAANKKDFLSLHSPSIRAVVGNSTVGASAELIDALPNLEIVSTYSVGLDKVDLRKCRERGIKVTNTPDVLTDDVADLAIGLMICTLRHICASDRYVRNGLWRGFGNYKLTTKFTGKTTGIVGFGRIGFAIAKRAEAFDCPFSGKTVGIVGLGRIGMAIAKRSEVFGCTIIYHSRSDNPGANYRFYSNIVDLAAHSDILVLSCPLTEETHHIVDQAVINALGPEGVLVNIGRGSLVDEPELVKALLDKRLGGAGLDVFEWEPEPPKELFDLDNVVLSPHVAGSTVETSKDMADLVVKNLEAYAMGKPLLTPVLQ